MIAKQYDKVVLSDGRQATVVEVLGSNELYICDVEHDDDYDTIDVLPSQIRTIID